jgi:hypothetical protein
MEKPNSDYYLLAYLGRLFLSQKALLLNMLEQIHPLHQLSYYIHVSLSLDALFEFQKERVRKHLHDTALVAKSARCTL